MNKTEAQTEKDKLLKKIQELDAIIAAPVITKEQRWWQIVNSITSVKVDKEEYADSTFFFIGEKVAFEYDSKNQHLWVNYYTIWSIFKSEFSMGYSAIQDFITGMVEEHFKCKGVTTMHGLVCLP